MYIYILYTYSFFFVYIIMLELTRREYNIIAKNRGVIEPQNMSTQELLNTFSRYDSRRKVKSNRR